MTEPELKTEPAFDLALASDLGKVRTNNEDAVGRMDDEAGRVLFIVADGVGGYEGGEEASRMAVEVTIQAFRDAPLKWGSAKRLYRAVQQANISIYERATIVPELRAMRTTITAVVVEGPMLYAAHVGDCRLYLLRGPSFTQLTKDHTLAASRARVGLIAADRVADHPDRSTLTRCLGQDLLVAIDQISRPLQGQDLLLVCTDGLYGAVGDVDLARLCAAPTAEAACSALLEEGNARMTPDNLTAAVLRVLGNEPLPEEPRGLRQRFSRLIGM